MDAVKTKTARKKLSRQYVIMVLIVQIITAFFFCDIIRKETIDIYLSAKNDLLSTVLNLQRDGLYMDVLPAFSWGLDYWKENYEKLADINHQNYEALITDEGEEFFEDIYTQLTDDEDEDRAFLNSLSPEEQLEFARYLYIELLMTSGGTTDFYGYEGSCWFISKGNGEYIVLAHQFADQSFLYDSIYVETSSESKDKMMAQLSKYTYGDKDDSVVEYIRMEGVDKDGNDINLYTGFVPIVYDGEIKAVITLEYNYDSFSSSVNRMISIVLVCVLLASALVCILFVHRTRKIATDPISSIQSAVREYMTTKDIEQARSKLHNIYSANEIGLLAEDVDKMLLETGDHVKEMEEAGNKLKNLTSEVMEALAGAIDAKDKYTNGHSRRVARYSRMIAEQAGKNEDECEKILFTALLHDVGKIGIPLEIIQKEKRLEEWEYEKIKEHTTVGSQILSKISDYPWLSDGAHYHHERYDGKGYPEGLRGNEIPENARIIAVADAYDAMASNRSYRSAIPQHIVREEFVKGIGKQFDPQFAKIMIRLIDLDTEYDMREKSPESEAAEMGSLRCDEIYKGCTEGIRITDSKKKIRFISEPDAGLPFEESLPTVIIYDSLDGNVHPGEEDNRDILYFEYARIRLDGLVSEKNVRKSEYRIISNETDLERQIFGDTEHGQKYRVEAFRNRDHVLVRVSNDKEIFEVILALPDNARYSYISLSGEHCELHNIAVEDGSDNKEKNDIPRIAEEISLIRGCPEGDLPNFEIDGPRQSYSEGVPVGEGVTLTFHSVSYPSSRLAWHCPYITIFSSPDGQVSNDAFHQYLLLKIDGEGWEPDELSESVVNVSQTEKFSDWQTWNAKNKQGIDCKVIINRDGNKIKIHTENLGIIINSVTTLKDDVKDVYAAITGDQCAITNIHISRI